MIPAPADPICALSPTQIFLILSSTFGHVALCFTNVICSFHLNCNHLTHQAQSCISLFFRTFPPPARSFWPALHTHQPCPMAKESSQETFRTGSEKPQCVLEKYVLVGCDRSTFKHLPHLFSCLCVARISNCNSFLPIFIF